MIFDPDCRQNQRRPPSNAHPPNAHRENGTLAEQVFCRLSAAILAGEIAPGAKIVLAETPVAETEGVTGLPEMMNAERSLINAGVGDVISQSFGATENTFPGFDGPDTPSLLNLRYAFKDALRHHVTVLAASGDDGATDGEADGVTTYPMAVNSWPSSDPLVTSVGGTMLNLDNNGNRLSPDAVWNDGFGAGGGGVDNFVTDSTFMQVTSASGERNIRFGLRLQW